MPPLRKQVYSIEANVHVLYMGQNHGKVPRYSSALFIVRMRTDDQAEIPNLR